MDYKVINSKIRLVGLLLAASFQFHEAAYGGVHFPQTLQSEKQVTGSPRGTPHGIPVSPQKSPIKLSSPRKPDYEIYASSVQDYSDTYVAHVIEATGDLLTRKEQKIFASIPFRPYILNISNPQEDKLLYEISGIFDLWQRRKEIRQEIDKNDEKFSQSNVIATNLSKLNPIAEMLKEDQMDSTKITVNLPFVTQIAQKLGKSVLFFDVGTNNFGCMDIIKRIIFVQYNPESKSTEMYFDKVSWLRDHKLSDLTSVCTKDTLVICYNSSLGRSLFSLPFDQEIPTLDEEQSDFAKGLKRSVLRVNTIHSLKNKALVTVGAGIVTVGAGIAVLVEARFAYLQRELLINFCKCVAQKVFSFAKEPLNHRFN